MKTITDERCYVRGCKGEVTHRASPLIGKQAGEWMHYCSDCVPGNKRRETDPWPVCFKVERI